MKEGWKDRDFVECLKKVPKQKAVKSKDYLDVGLYPIVSQESCLVSGYSNIADILYKHDRPVVIFGDHTKNVKYVDFDFIVGADGVHIFDVKDDILPKFFYYELSSIKLRDLGYARHYKLLKEKRISFPSLSEQERIVSYLDAQFAIIDALKANTEQQLQAAKDLFQSALKEYLTPKEGWEKKTLKSIGKTQTGCTPAMSHKEYYNEDYMPFIKPSEINYDGIGGINYDTQMLSKLGAENGRVFDAGSTFMVCIGTIGKLGFSDRQVSCNQQINVITPKEEYNKKFIYYALLNPSFVKEVEVIARSAQATLPIISKGKWENLEVFIPSLKEQRDIVVILDSLSAKIKALQENYNKTLVLCNDLKQSLLKSIFE